MKTRSLLAIGTYLLAQLAAAQSVPDHSFMLGPTVGIDQVSYVNTAGYVGSASSYSPASINYGLDASYQVNRLLVGAKLLYAKRLYQMTPAPYPRPLGDPDYFKRIDTDLSILTLPVSIGYRLTPYGRFQWHVGGNIAVDYLVSSSDSRYISAGGVIGLTSRPDKSDFGKSVNIGYGVQTTLRYQLTPGLGLQLEPALRYYPRGGFPTTIYSNYQFQSVFSVLFKV